MTYRSGFAVPAREGRADGSCAGPHRRLIGGLVCEDDRMSDPAGVEFPVDALPAAQRSTYDGLTDVEAAQLRALCDSIRRSLGEVEGFGVRHRRGRVPVELPDLPGVDVQIVSDNVRSLGAIYYAWSLGGWPP